MWQTFHRLDQFSYLTVEHLPQHCAHVDLAFGVFVTL